jgi:hypothetical protein
MVNAGQDTAPLKAEQLSAHQVQIINEIEDRLRTGLKEPHKPRERSVRELRIPLLNRLPRVMLLDGERGTGKTSVLLTLMKRWHGEWSGEASGLKQAPEDPYVIGNVDFDPLPPGMPLIGGMVQAWKPLVEAIEDIAPPCDDASFSLLDRWHSLFRMAVSGWSEVQGSAGLIEQILEREDQVRDWLRFAEKWREFIDFVACEAVKHAEALQLTRTPIFVIVVDDCDLQVARVAELLPALRNLYHERVFFLVAGDKRHMIDMLRLDFAGQQAKLGHDFHPGATGLQDMLRRDWAAELAYSTFEKVFTRGNQWRLQTLSLAQFLAYPEQPGTGVPGEGTFYALLHRLELPTGATAMAESGSDSLPSDQDCGAGPADNVGDFLWRFAADAEEASLPGVMTYRAVQQLYDVVYAEDDIASSDAGTQILAALFSSAFANGRARIEADATIDVPFTGEIAALFRPKAIEFSRFDVVFGTRADFSYLPYGSSTPKRLSQSPRVINWTAMLAAKALEEAKGPVDAAGIRWDTYLSLAWTEWQRPSASFSWDRHRHPSPDQLLRQAQEWAACVRQLGYRSSIDRLAYAWVYHQVKWNSDKPIPEELSPETASGDLPWDGILKLDPTEDPTDWRDRTLPLLARPEIGLSEDVQRKLLAARNTDKDPSLAKIRRRLVRNAVLAFAAQRGRELPALAESKDVEGFIIEIEEDHMGKNNGRHSPWHEEIELKKDEAVDPDEAASIGESDRSG